MNKILSSSADAWSENMDTLLAPKVQQLYKMEPRDMNNDLSRLKNKYCEIIFICWTFYFVFFVSRAIYEVKIPTKYLFI